MKRRTFIKAAAGAALGTMPRIGASAAQAQGASRSIRIGMSVSSTGNFALASQSAERGYRLWIEDVNRRGGVATPGGRRTVELVVRDDRSDRQLVPRVYEGLINEDRVDFLIAPFSSTLVSAAVPISERHERFMITGFAASDAIFEQGYRYLVQTCVPTSALPRTTLEQFKLLGGRRVAVIGADDAFPSSFSGFTRAQAERLGLQVALFERYPRTNRDFSVLLQRARAVDAELLFLTGYETDVISIVRQSKEANIAFAAVYSLYSSVPAVLALGADVEHFWGAGYFDTRARWAVSKGFRADQLIDAYRTLFPRAPHEADFQTAVAYGTAAVIEAALEIAPDLSAASLKSAAVQLSGRITVLTGPYRIDESGLQTGMSVLLMQNRNGGQEIIAPAETATAAAVYPMPAWTQR